jgi:5-formyltetrahydrofolate cyclo-ligase
MVVLPRVDQASQSLTLHTALNLSDLLVSKWGIQEPAANARTVSIADVDFVLLPGVAFDRAGNRLGYGRGYYDKLLSAAEPALARVAAAFSCQIVDEVPVGPGDQKVHQLITENETIVTSHDR